MWTLFPSGPFKQIAEITGLHLQNILYLCPTNCQLLATPLHPPNQNLTSLSLHVLLPWTPFSMYTRLILDRIVWDPQHKKVQLLLEKVQLFAARLAIKSWSQGQTSLFTNLNLSSLMNHSSYIPKLILLLKFYNVTIFSVPLFFYLSPSN